MTKKHEIFPRGQRVNYGSIMWTKNSVHPHPKILSDLHLNVSNRRKEQTTFSGQKLLADKQAKYKYSA